MSRVYKIFVVAVVMSVMLVLGAGPAFASNSGDFPLETFVCDSLPGPPGTIGIGTGIDTPGATNPCVPTEVGPPEDDNIFE